MAPRKQGSLGGQLTRSEVVTVRLDPRLRYGVDLAARKHRRTASSIIEWAIEKALKEVMVCESEEEHLTRSIDDVLREVWDVDEPDRFAKLALECPELLSHEEQVLWKLIRECGHLWEGKNIQGNDKEEWVWRVTPEGLIFKRLRKHWDELKKVASGELSPRALPFEHDLPALYRDDNIPF